MKRVIAGCAAIVVTAGFCTGIGQATASQSVNPHGQAGVSSQAVSSALPSATEGPCGYIPTPDDPAVRPIDLPPDPDPTPDSGRAYGLLATNRGPIDLRLDRAKAPCTVQSFLHLARNGFYDFTTCHRLTAYPTLKVLQCGDPSGTGEGGPGYRYADELPTDLEPAPGDPSGKARIYPRGTLAMANAGPDTNGSQFFLVYGDSKLLPDYTVFGSVGRLGLSTLDRVAAGGISGADAEPPVDGKPKRKTDILLAPTLG